MLHETQFPFGSKKDRKPSLSSAEVDNQGDAARSTPTSAISPEDYKQLMDILKKCNLQSHSLPTTTARTIEEPSIKQLRLTAR